MAKAGYVYIMSSFNNTTLYVGVTSNIEQRVWQHQNSTDNDAFTSKYKCRKLVYVEEYGSIVEAITREKQIKNWKRVWKDALVTGSNPEWIDLAKPDPSDLDPLRHSGLDPESLGPQVQDCGSSPQ
jgi:putative endonuclease